MVCHVCLSHMNIITSAIKHVSKYCGIPVFPENGSQDLPYLIAGVMTTYKCIFIHQPVPREQLVRVQSILAGHCRYVHLWLLSLLNDALLVAGRPAATMLHRCNDFNGSYRHLLSGCSNITIFISTTNSRSQVSG
jgi:hypothetical protein